ncbi:MAG: CARDB domain-containing protein [Dehalococcoidales bacterium]
MSYIFIAHVEEDADIALGIVLGLEEAGFRTWCYEIDSLPGQQYLEKTGEAIEQSEAVIIMISPNSLSSNQVTNEVVRAYEERKQLIPLLRDISYAEFQQRQPVWRQAIGAAAAVRIPKDNIVDLLPQITDSLKSSRIRPDAKPDMARIVRIRKRLEEIQGRPPSTTKPLEEIKKVKSEKPLIITIVVVSLIVIAIVAAAVFLPHQGGNGAPPSTTTTTTSPAATGTSASQVISTTPSGTVKPTTSTSAPTPTTSPVSTTATGLKPDLVIQDITWSPQNPNLGDTVTFTIFVINQGKAKAAPSYVAYYVDSGFKESLSVSSIDAGAMVKVTFTWKAALGNHAIKAVADYNNAVDESDETNNAKEINFLETVAPDLIIQDITWTPTNPSRGNNITYTIITKNQGNGTAGYFQVYLYVSGEYKYAYKIDKLYPGQIATIVFNPTSYAYVSGTFLIKLVADAENTVPESDETNNSKTVTIFVQ